MDVHSGWVQILRGPRPHLTSGPEQMCSASVSHMHQWEQDPSAIIQALSGSVSLETVLSCPHSSRQQVPRRCQEVCIFQGGRLQAAPVWTKTIRRGHRCSRLSNAQTVLPPVDQRIADCVQFIECAKKRVQSAEADAKKAVERLREGELADAEQRLVDLQQEAARAVNSSPRTFKRRPPSQSGLWRFRGPAHQSGFWPDSEANRRCP